jgi:glycopeptide antibiotics resistance protein
MLLKNRNVAWLIVCLGLTFVALATLSPFTFDFHAISAATFFGAFRHFPSSPLDFPKNILLFLPLGIGLAMLLERSNLPAFTRLLLLVFVGFLLSLMVETLQIFLPHRTPNTSDLISNSIGMLVGLGMLKFLRTPWFYLKPLIRCIAGRRTGPFFSAYSIIVVTAAFFLMRGISPNGWDETYHLSIGNESDGNWPWRGVVSDVVLLHAGVSRFQANLLLKGEIPADVKGFAARYRLSSAEPTAHLGQLGKLEWTGPAQTGAEGAILSKRSALRSAQPLASYAKAVNASREFTIGFRGRTFDPDQAAFPRVLTLSQDDSHVNAMLAQHWDALEVRWRATLSGEGTTPQLYFEHVFSSTNRISAVLSFRSNVLSLYTADAPPVSVCLGPEIAFEALLRDAEQWLVYVSPTSFLFSALLFALFFYAPLAICITLRERFEAGSEPSCRRFESVFLLALPVGVEMLVSCFTRQSPRFSVLWIGVLAAFTPLFAIRRILGMTQVARRFPPALIGRAGVK